MEVISYKFIFCLFFSLITGPKDFILIAALSLPVAFFDPTHTYYSVFFSVICVRLLKSFSLFVTTSLFEAKTESLEFLLFLVLYLTAMPNLIIKSTTSDGFQLFKLYFSSVFVFVLPSLIFLAFLQVLSIATDKLYTGNSMILKPIKGLVSLLLFSAIIIGIRNIA